MNYISLTNFRTLSTITICVDASHRYIVKVTGLTFEGSEQSGLLDIWESLKEAMICAKGIAKMFELHNGFILFDCLIFNDLQLNSKTS